MLKIAPEEILDHNVNGISGNSKNIKNNYIYVAIKGAQFDGSDFINEARQNGAQLPGTAMIDQFYSGVQALGGGRWDTSSLLKLLQDPKSSF